MSEDGSAARQVAAILGRALAVDESTLTPETAIADLPADSLRLMEVLCELEEQLGVGLPESNAFVTSLESVGDIVEAVERARGDR